MERDDEEMPPDEAYGRVTNPERYAVLHDAARTEIDRLVATYEVERTDGTDLDPSTRRGWTGSPATRLVPTGGGAPLTISLTAFPGVRISAGHAYRDGFPSCGCDACDEDPADLVERLLEQIGDVVAGGLTETRRSRILRPDSSTIRLERVDDPGGFSESQGEVEDERAGLPVGRTEWPAWTPRG